MCSFHDVHSFSFTLSSGGQCNSVLILLPFLSHKLGRTFILLIFTHLTEVLIFTHLTEVFFMFLHEYSLVTLLVVVELLTVRYGDGKIRIMNWRKIC
uniref:Uncharacterized protein n=1 Tax=Arundo donax TaxID=35708 RepID=A0A0A9FGH0_ARUDO